MRAAIKKMQDTLFAQDGYDAQFTQSGEVEAIDIRVRLSEQTTQADVFNQPIDQNSIIVFIRVSEIEKPTQGDVIVLDEDARKFEFTNDIQLTSKGVLWSVVALKVL